MNYDDAKDALLESLLSRSFEIESTEESPSEVYYEPAYEGYGSALPLLEEEDRDILLHREAHFASSFPLMIQAYENEARSAVLDVDVASIKRLMHIEEKLGKNLAPFILHGDDAVKIAQVRKMYRLLAEAHAENKNNELAAIADLILSEDDEIEDVAKKAASLGPQIVPSLLTIIENDLLYDPLWPGYGQAPCIAALALGELHVVSAIPALFSMLQSDTFDVQNASLKALCMLQEPAKQFCIAQLQSRPISRNNELAALALCSFPCDENIIQAVSRELANSDVNKHRSLVSYLEACSEEFPK